jgi:hypothetical protein
VLKFMLPTAGLLLALVILSYLESPFSLINKDHVRMTSIPNEVLLAEADADPFTTIEEETNAEVNEEGDEIIAQNYTLELVLEKKDEINDYVLETYREYEIYKDANGNVVKKVPTERFEYLRYKK